MGLSIFPRIRSYVDRRSRGLIVKGAPAILYDRFYKGGKTCWTNIDKIDKSPKTFHNSTNSRFSLDHSL